MKTRIATILTSLILTITAVYGQSYEPLELAKKIFGKDSFPNILDYSSGEYKGRPNGQDLQDGSITRFRLLAQMEKTAVVAMTIVDSAGSGFDSYLYFQKDKTWKMTTLRALAMTGIIEQVKIELEKMTLEQVDAMIAESKKNKKEDDAFITSREDYQFQLGNTKLTLDLDDNIINHFLSNQAEFERLKEFALAELKNKKNDEDRSVKLIETLKPAYQKIYISSVSTEFENCITFEIGGMLDNTVGYIYVLDKKHLPEMDPDRIIMIREIGNGWYIYKTT